MLPAELMDIRDVASVMDKDYELACPVCLVEHIWIFESKHCSQCHETIDEQVFDLHRYRRGCRYPGNLDRFYEVKFHNDTRVWYQKPDPNAPKEKDDS